MPTNIDVSNNTKRRFGAPLIAVNPKNPNNIIVYAQINLAYTHDCLPAKTGSDCEIVGLLGQPRGFFETRGFTDVGVFVSFDRGQTFKYVDVSTLSPPGHPEIIAKGEGPIAAMLDGTFYIGTNAINWGSPDNFFPNGGMGVMKSSDGGLTWEYLSLTGTPADWPFGGADLTTGTLIAVSGLPGLSTIGPRSTGDAKSPEGTIADRWLATSTDGVTWTEPNAIGGDQGERHVSGGGSVAMGAFGIIATMFTAADQSSCRVFLGNTAPSSCIVFQTSTDAGATWKRHQVPTPAGVGAGRLSTFVAADSVQEKHFAAVLLDGKSVYVYRTADAGETWSDVTTVSQEPNKTHWAPWVAMSPGGQMLGVMWRQYETEAAKAGANAPYLPWSVWAAISKDGGATFSKPLKVSQANSPAPPDDPNDSFSFVGDHGASGIAVDDAGGVFVAWADWTPGERAIFFSAASVDAFEF